MGRSPNLYYVSEQGQYIIRYADERQMPKRLRSSDNSELTRNLGDMARESVVRYARHHGLAFRWLFKSVPYEVGTIWLRQNGEMWPSKWRWARATALITPMQTVIQGEQMTVKLYEPLEYEGT